MVRAPECSPASPRAAEKLGLALLAVQRQPLHLASHGPCHAGPGSQRGPMPDGAAPHLTSRGRVMLTPDRSAVSCPTGPRSTLPHAGHVMLTPDRSAVSCPTGPRSTLPHAGHVMLPPDRSAGVRAEPSARPPRARLSRARTVAHVGATVKEAALPSAPTPHDYRRHTAAGAKTQGTPAARLIPCLALPRFRELSLRGAVRHFARSAIQPTTPISRRAPAAYAAAD
jgi:hypothetical protein